MAVSLQPLRAPGAVPRRRLARPRSRATGSMPSLAARDITRQWTLSEQCAARMSTKVSSGPFALNLSRSGHPGSPSLQRPRKAWESPAEARARVTRRRAARRSQRSFLPSPTVGTSPGRSRSPSPSHCVLYVQDIGKDKSEKLKEEAALVQLFSQYGGCVSAVCHSQYDEDFNDLSYAVVTMSTEQAAQAALAAKVMAGGHELRVGLHGPASEEMAGRATPHAGGGVVASASTGHVLHVRGVGKDRTGKYKEEQALKVLFSQFGECQAAMVRPRQDEQGNDTSWALVTMDSLTAVEKALAQEVSIGDGHVLQITRYSQKTAAASTGAMGTLAKKLDDSFFARQARLADARVLLAEAEWLFIRAQELRMVQASNRVITTDVQEEGGAQNGSSSGASDSSAADGSRSGSGKVSLWHQVAEKLGAVLDLDPHCSKALRLRRQCTKAIAEDKQAEKRMGRFQLFRRRYGKDWQDAMNMERDPASITEDQLREMFDMVDSDGGGSLDREEVETLIYFFAAAGDQTVVAEEVIDGAMAAMDDDNSGEVSFEEFSGWWKVHGQAVAAGALKEQQVLAQSVLNLPALANAKPSSAATGQGGGTGRRDTKPSAAQGRQRGEKAQPHAQQEAEEAMNVDELDEKQLEATLRKIFNSADDDESGEIDAEELRSIMESLGHSITQKQAEAMVAEIDADGSGTVDFEEFKQMFTTQQQQQSGGGGGRGASASGGFVSKLRESTRKQVGRLAFAEEKMSWSYGKAMRLPNGTFSAVFSLEAYEAALEFGAEPVASRVASVS